MPIMSQPVRPLGGILRGMKEPVEADCIHPGDELIVDDMAAKFTKQVMPGVAIQAGSHQRAISNRFNSLIHCIKELLTKGGLSIKIDSMALYILPKEWMEFDPGFHRQAWRRVPRRRCILSLKVGSSIARTLPDLISSALLILSAK